METSRHARLDSCMPLSSRQCVEQVAVPAGGACWCHNLLHISHSCANQVATIATKPPLPHDASGTWHHKARPAQHLLPSSPTCGARRRAETSPQQRTEREADQVVQGTAGKVSIHQIRRHLGANVSNKANPALLSSSEAGALEPK
jgi:hypothetical protein